MRLILLERALGYEFRQRDLLQQAVTHRSYGAPHNERLEFLGDSILNCTIAAQLYARFPSIREGDLSRLRASLVRQDTLFKIAEGAKVGDFLQLGEGELKSGGFRRPSILADAMEAIFGAIYLDAGFDAAATVIGRLFTPLLEAINPHDTGKDPKTALQEFLQGRRLGLPAYNLLEVSGEAHAQAFEVECVIAGLEVRTVGNGNSRRAAEQDAASLAMTAIAQLNLGKKK